MFKLFGGTMVIMAAGLMGAGKYAEMSERRRILGIIGDGAQRIRDNLNCMCMPLYDCFLCSGEFFSKVASYMSKGESPSVSVKKSADGINCFSKEDREILYRFSEGLMSENCAGQIRNVDILIAEIKKNEENAKKQLECKGKLLLKGSLLMAAAIVLVLI